MGEETTQRYTLPKQERLTRSGDFKKVFARRRSVSDEGLIVYGCGNGLGFSRLGMSVSRKVGPAVLRNRLRRLYREAFRLTKNELPAGLDLILIPRRSMPPRLEELKQSLGKLVKALARKLAREDKAPCPEK